VLHQMLRMLFRLVLNLDCAVTMNLLHNVSLTMAASQCAAPGWLLLRVAENNDIDSAKLVPGQDARPKNIHGLHSS
jgi:hypothetical protein